MSSLSEATLRANREDVVVLRKHAPRAGLVSTGSRADVAPKPAVAAPTLKAAATPLQGFSPSAAPLSSNSATAASAPLLLSPWLKLWDEALLDPSAPSSNGGPDAIVFDQQARTGTASGSGFRGVEAEVGELRRLRVTRGVVLPTETPIHGIFGSKDVIHS